MRFALSLLLALFVGQALVYPAAAALEICTQTCPDDRPDGSCDPQCADCSCCHHVSRLPAAIPGALAPEPTSSRALREEVATPAPACDPRDVFHVPRSRA